MRILIVEDEQKMAALLHRGLRRHGYAADVAADGGAALRLAAVTAYDAILLDVGLPDMDGIEACRRLREAGSAVPVLVLTARDGVFDRVAGLDAGADDYLVKPFAFAELLARLRAILRRPARRFEMLRVAGIDVDPVHRHATVNDRRVDLSRVEFDLLFALAEQRGSTLTRRDLLASVWGYRFDPGTNVVDVHVGRLRRKLEVAGAAGAIRTVRGVGYAIGE